MMPRTAVRLGTSVAAPVAALAAWGAARLLGVDLVLDSGAEIGAWLVAALALGAAALGWVVSAEIGRRSRFPRSVWAFVGSTAFSVSVIAPGWLAHGADAIAIIAIEFVVAVVVTAGHAAALPVHAPARPGSERR